MRNEPNRRRRRRRNNEHPNRIRNGQIRRDFKRLLTIIAEADLPHDTYAEAEAIASRHALRFGDDGQVREVRG